MNSNQFMSDREQTRNQVSVKFLLFDGQVQSHVPKP